ncbi:vWA domain-containing protein [Streptomyces aidingensis]|uniref:TerF vWA domain-containing protein n=1 Tax=Streptomyces aidingensis TaxID=910347 RepID=A0A1I1S6Y0_9ACTN|nr:VWA domain-containing protein [Streptomyces aidingensis]SFD39583.1 TerF vWA domain-containing protein [Streptomyces aidingensis]
MANDHRKRPDGPDGRAAPVRDGSAAGPAISLEKVRSTAAGLVPHYTAARVTLEKTGLAGRRAAVYLVLDRSGSMRPYYRDGTVQRLAEQVLALAAHLDDDGVVPLVFFSTGVDGIAGLPLDGYAGRIAALHASYGHMGRTNYHLAMRAVIEHHRASGTPAPAFVVFQTDGGPTSRRAAEELLCEAAGLPLFWQFIGFGDPDDKQFDFLRRLDELPVPGRRAVDNAGFFPAGTDPSALTDEELYKRLMLEFPDWLAEARRAGVLR